MGKAVPVPGEGDGRGAARENAIVTDIFGGTQAIDDPAVSVVNVPLH